MCVVSCSVGTFRLSVLIQVVIALVLGMTSGFLFVCFYYCILDIGGIVFFCSFPILLFRCSVQVPVGAHSASCWASSCPRGGWEDLVPFPQSLRPWLREGVEPEKWGPVSVLQR